MNKTKNSTKAIIAVIVILIIIIGVFAALNHNNSNQSGDSVTVKIGDNAETVYTIDDLKTMDNISTVHKTIKSGQKEDETGDFTGIALRDLLLQTVTEDELTSYSAVTVTSGDGYATSYDIDEIMQPQNIMLIFEQDGNALVPYTDGGSGPLRIVVMNDDFGTRSAMWVTGITLE